MPSHFDSTVGPLKETVNELVEPIESIQSQIHDGETGYVPDGLELIVGELTMVVLVFTNADLNITDAEMELLNNFRRAICGDHAFSLTSQAYLDMCRRFLRIHPYRRLSIDHKPYTVQYLQIYDRQHGTENAEKAKAVFFQLAKVVVQVDGIEKPQEMITLLNFKETLDSPVTEMADLPTPRH